MGRPLDLQPVIQWLKNGCSVEDAIKELEIYDKKLKEANKPVAARHVIDAAAIEKVVSQWATREYGYNNPPPTKIHVDYLGNVTALIE